jgi:hypothetical protein
MKIQGYYREIGHKRLDYGCYKEVETRKCFFHRSSFQLTKLDGKSRRNFPVHRPEQRRNLGLGRIIIFLGPRRVAPSASMAEEQEKGLKKRQPSTSAQTASLRCAAI